MIGQTAPTDPVDQFLQPGKDIERRVGDLERSLARIGNRTVAGPWTNAALSGTWANYGAPFLGAQYRKVGDMVQVRGLVRSGAVNSTVFTLPVGSRPPLDLQFPSGPPFNGLTIEVRASGVVFMYASSTTVASLNFEFSVLS